MIWPFSRWFASLIVRLDEIKITLIHFEKKTMATLQDVKDSITGLGTDLDAEFAAIAAKIDSLSQSGGASSADLDALKASVESARGRVQAETASLTPSPSP